MDYQEKKQLREIAARQVADAERYARAREAGGAAELALNLILVTKIEEVRKLKKNVGIEFAQLMICSECEEAKGYYKAWKENEAICRGLKRLIEARDGQLIMEQSLLKNERDGARFG
jgi:hypothetical protein